MKLTKQRIDGFRFKGKSVHDSDLRWDTSLPGFGVQVYQSGKKSFLIWYRINGRLRRMTLGAYGILTLDQARDIAKVKLSEVIQGRDPLEEKQKATKGETISDLCNDYLNRHAKERKRTWRQDERRINGRILPAWGSRKVVSIKRQDVAALHATIGRDGRYEANAVLMLLSKMFNLASRWGYVPEGHSNPATGIDKFRGTKRDRWITPQELPKLAKAINLEPNPYIKSAMWLWLLTGCRKSELLSSRWDNVDYHRRELRLPETKAGRVHYVPLSEPAIKILMALPREQDNPFVFCGRLSGTHIKDVRSAWDRIRETAKLKDVRLHDLRRTVGSWLAGGGASLPLIGKVLNHTNTSTTQIYARLADEQAKFALEEHSKKLLEIASIDTV